MEHVRMLLIVLICVLLMISAGLLRQPAWLSIDVSMIYMVLLVILVTTLL